MAPSDTSPEPMQIESSTSIFVDGWSEQACERRIAGGDAIVNNDANVNDSDKLVFIPNSVILLVRAKLDAGIP
jgi:hypothetical protein